MKQITNFDYITNSKQLITIKNTVFNSTSTPLTSSISSNYINSFFPSTKQPQTLEFLLNSLTTSLSFLEQTNIFNSIDLSIGLSPLQPTTSPIDLNLLITSTEKNKLFGKTSFNFSKYKGNCSLSTEMGLRNIFKTLETIRVTFNVDKNPSTSFSVIKPFLLRLPGERALSLFTELKLIKDLKRAVKQFKVASGGHKGMIEVVSVNSSNSFNSFNSFYVCMMNSLLSYVTPFLSNFNNFNKESNKSNKQGGKASLNVSYSYICPMVLDKEKKIKLNFGNYFVEEKNEKNEKREKNNFENFGKNKMSLIFKSTQSMGKVNNYFNFDYNLFNKLIFNIGDVPMFFYSNLNFEFSSQRKNIKNVFFENYSFEIGKENVKKEIKKEIGIGGEIGVDFFVRNSGVGMGGYIERVYLKTHVKKLWKFLETGESVAGVKFGFGEVKVVVPLYSLVDKIFKSELRSVFDIFRLEYCFSKNK